MNTREKNLVVIAGPTAVGKTALAITLARMLGTEIVSADSRQLFRELDIGTAKPSEEELRAVKHHFINSHSLDEPYDAARYGREALAVIQQLFTTYDTVVLCGGSGLYIKAVCEGFDDIPDIPVGIRESLIEQYRREGIGWLQEQMRRLEPDLVSRMDIHNPHRMIRALEVRMATGKSITFFQRGQKFDHDFNIVKVGLELPRELLYKRIDERMDKMIASGLFDEAAALYSKRDKQALQTVGYREVFDFMEGQYDRAEAVRLLKRNSRRYAKRQLTWFKKDAEITWFDARQPERVINFVRAQIASGNESRAEL